MIAERELLQLAEEADAGATVPPRRGLFGLAAEAVRRFIARSRERRALAELDTRLLRDIGVDVAAARAEAAKPLWRA